MLGQEWPARIRYEGYGMDRAYEFWRGERTKKRLDQQVDLQREYCAICFSGYPCSTRKTQYSHLLVTLDS
jgi:hypothetical protein